MDDLDRGRSRYLACASIMYDSTSKILRALINNRCKPDLETYIATNKDKINRIKIVPHFKKVVLEENPNIDEWDTSILCWFLLNIVEVQEKKQLNDIRAIRNQLVHCSDSYLKEEQYQNILKLIKSVVKYFEHLTDLDLDLSKEIDRFNIIDPDIKTMERTIHDTIRWHRSELKIVQAAISMPLTEVKDETSTTATVKMEGDVKTRKFDGKRLALSMPLTEVKDETSTTATVKMEGDVKTRKFYGKRLAFCLYHYKILEL